MHLLPHVWLDVYKGALCFLYIEGAYFAYYSHVFNIFDIAFKSFKVVLFKARWYKLLLQADERTIIDHDNVLTMIDTTRNESSIESYVLPSQCEQVFYSLVMSCLGWSFFC